MLNLRKIWILIALLATLLLSGCNDDILGGDLTETEESPMEDVYIRFRMNLSGSGSPGTTRADATTGESGNTTPGTGQEEEVNTVDIFIYDAESNQLSDHVYLSKEKISEITTTGVVVPIYATPGKNVRIHTAANLTEKMRQSYIIGQTGNDQSITSTLSDYKDVINEFVPGTSGHHTTLQNNQTPGIPMTGQFKTDDTGSYEITIPLKAPTKNNPLELTAKVSRIVAKIHLLVQTSTHVLATGETVTYAHAEDKSATEGQPTGKEGEEYTNFIGWMRLSDIRYVPNGMNKSTYIFPQANEKAGSYPLKDPNMDMSHYRRGDQFDEQEYLRDFTFRSGAELHPLNITDSDNMDSAESYDETRLATTQSGSPAQDRYTNGMYCLENYFDIPQPDHEFLKTYNNAIPMVTHLSIATKLTPRYITVSKTYAEGLDRFIKAFKEKTEIIRKKYRLDPTDFTDEDIDRWAILKERYFPANDDSNIYSNDFRIIKTLNEADAADLIKWSLIANNLWSGDNLDFENDKYPACTFYVYDRKKYDAAGLSADDTYKQRYLYLTAGAVAVATGDNMRIKTYSVPHIGGWGYYFTYLDQTQETTNGKTPYTASQVTRNTYYLVNVMNFGVPGSTITSPEYLKVNTVPIGWDYSGKGDINLH